MKSGGECGSQPGPRDFSCYTIMLYNRVAFLQHIDIFLDRCHLTETYCLVWYFVF